MRLVQDDPLPGDAEQRVGLDPVSRRVLPAELLKALALVLAHHVLDLGHGCAVGRHHEVVAGQQAARVVLGKEEEVMDQVS